MNHPVGIGSYATPPRAAGGCSACGAPYTPAEAAQEMDKAMVYLGWTMGIAAVLTVVGVGYILYRENQG